MSTAVDVTKLATRLEQCEEAFERAENDAWSALRRIHDDELWRADESYGTWQNYVEKRWGFTRHHAHRLIDSSRLIEHFKAQGIATLPTCEAHTRPLTRLRQVGRKPRTDKEFLDAATFAWERVVETAPEKFDAPIITAKHVETTVGHFEPPPSPRSKITLRDLRMWLTRGKRLLRQLGDPDKLDCSQLGGDFEPVLHALIELDQRRPR